MARCAVRILTVLLIILATGRFSLAADYSVDFGVETASGKDAGSLICRVGQTCTGEMDSLGLSVVVFRSEPERVTVHLYGRDLSCCYFAGAADSIAIDPHKPVSHVSFYRGVKARGALLIENERVGTLYLRFYSR